MTPLTFRTARGLTQQQAADLIGVTKLTWQRWELGKVECPQSVLMLLLMEDALCVGLDRVKQWLDEGWTLKRIRNDIRD